jgi:hypothetical protein
MELWHPKSNVEKDLNQGGFNKFHLLGIQSLRDLAIIFVI